MIYYPIVPLRQFGNLHMSSFCLTAVCFLFIAIPLHADSICSACVSLANTL